MATLLPQDDSTSSVSNFNTHEIQPQSLNPTYNQHHRPTVLLISENDSAAAEVEQVLENCCCKVVVACFAVTFTGVITLIFFGLAISITIIASIVTLPFLVVSVFVTRFIQLFRHGECYEKTLQLSLTLRNWIYAELTLLAFILLILSAITMHSHDFENDMLKILPIADHLYIFLLMFVACLHNVFILYCLISLMPSIPLAHTESSLYVRAAVLEIIDCLTFWVIQFLVMRAVPTLMHHKLLGLYTRRWIDVSILVLISNNVIKISTHIIVWLLRELAYEKLDPGPNEKSKRYFIMEKILQRKYLVYYANGTKHSINTILTSVMLLLTWVLYLRSKVDETPRTQDIIQFGTWTCVTFLIASLLWLIKTCLLLSWEASVVYNRLDWSSKIIDGGLQLHFLGIIDQHNYNVFNLLQIGWNPTMYGIQQVAAHFLTAKISLSKEDYTSVTLDNLKSSDQNDNGNRSIQEILKELMQHADDKTQKSCGCCRKGRVRHNWDGFKDQLRDYMDPSGEITLERVQAWMERARNNCLFLGNTLSSAMEVADCLNKIISVILISATFILWLLLTRLASTKVLVLIASPLLAATFVFGDTCKILFQGVFFVYAIHPFDVSDLCVIDGTMMEVRTIGIWKTTFTKVGTQEKVIYPNSELSKKNIINHKSDFDWNDYIEFDVDSMKDEKLKILKQEIEKHLEGNEDKFAPSYSWVVVTTNDTIKIAVYIRHIVHLQNSTNFECLKVKHKLRSDFVLYVKNLMDQ